MTESVLVATLGSEPQVVTLVLDRLGSKGIVVSEVVVVHTEGKPVQEALKLLTTDLARGNHAHLRVVPIRSGSGTITDVQSEEDVAALLRTLYRTILAEKRAGRQVHLSIAGGRKPMAVYGMVVAQLLFDEQDRVWHLLTENWGPGKERVMHWKPGDKVSEVEGSAARRPSSMKRGFKER